MFSRTSPGTGAQSPTVTGFHDPATGSIQYVVADDSTKKAALIDVVLDFDPAEARTRHDSAQEIVDFVRSEGLEVEWILDTHPHADHLMASAWLKEQLGAPAAIGARVRDIARLWGKIYNTPGAFDPDRDFDRLFEDGDTFKLGNLDVRVMLSPGHTLGSITYVVGDDAAFVHDTLMHVDVGTSRADFPGGSSNELYDSLQAILALPDQTRLFIGHDYPPVGIAQSLPGKRPWPATRPKIRMSGARQRVKPSPGFAMIATPRSACRTGCSTPCRSTCAAVACPIPKATGIATSRSPQTVSETRKDQE
ncbi:beta-lactamase-like protein [Roseobacter sp. AzwK-3b]|nr:beta-lactamase-like protein [Roseobacter sp. AzwK-3b]